MKSLFLQNYQACSTRLAATALGCALVAGSGMAQDVVPGKEVVELVEARAALKITQERLAETNKRFAVLDGERAALVEAFAKTKEENSLLRKQFAELTLQMEARGGALASGDAKVLEERLLKAVRNYDLAQDEADRLGEQLIRLSEVAVTFSQSVGLAEDAPARAMLEAELDNANRVLAETSALQPVEEGAPRIAGDSRVVSLDPSIGLVVLNVGRDQGFRVGMPIEISRTGQYVASATVIDVRDQIAGALLSEVRDDAGDVELGDQAAPQPQF